MHLKSTVTFATLKARFKRRGRALPVNFRKLMPSHNAQDRVTHLIHSYPAKVISHIPAFFLAEAELSDPGSTVLDPFCGAGTVMVEAILSGRNAIGADSNPLARLVASVKTTPIADSSIDRAFAALMNRASGDSVFPTPDVVNIKHWFSPRVIRELSAIRGAIDQCRRKEVREFFQVCFSQCVRRVSFADPRLSVPVRLNADRFPDDHPLHALNKQRLAAQRRLVVFDEFRSIVASNRRRLRAFSEIANPTLRSEVGCSDARDLRWDTGKGATSEKLASASVDLTITSPPYAGAQKYIRASSLSLGWLGLATTASLRSLEELSIGREHHRKSTYATYLETGIDSADRQLRRLHDQKPLRAHIAAKYLSEMRSSLKEIARVSKEGASLVLVLGNNTIAGNEFLTSRYVAQLAEQSGFRIQLVLLDEIRSRGLMTTRNRTAGIITRESVYVLERLRV